MKPKSCLYCDCKNITEKKKRQPYEWYNRYILIEVSLWMCDECDNGTMDSVQMDELLIKYRKLYENRSIQSSYGGCRKPILNNIKGMGFCFFYIFIAYHMLFVLG